MWRAQCREGGFTMGVLLREEAETALNAHVAETKHEEFSIMPVSARRTPDHTGPPDPCTRPGRHPRREERNR